jgi:hypothetical protein
MDAVIYIHFKTIDCESVINGAEKQQDIALAPYLNKTTFAQYQRKNLLTWLKPDETWLEYSLDIYLQIKA